MPERPLPRGSRGRAIDSMREHGKKYSVCSEHRAVPLTSFPRKTRLKQMLNILGLNPGERINFFCSFEGSWARALADAGCIVEATDVSDQWVNKLKRKPGKIKSVRQMPAQVRAIVPEYYDWDVSFEPYPVSDYNPKGLVDVARQSLLNKKGLILIFSGKPYLFRAINREFSILKIVADIYGAQIETKESTNLMKCNDCGGEELAVLIRLETNPQARKLAELDCYVERRLSSWHGTTNELCKKLAKEFGKTETEIHNAVLRIRYSEEAHPLIHSV